MSQFLYCVINKSLEGLFLSRRAYYCMCSWGISFSRIGHFKRIKATQHCRVAALTKATSINRIYRLTAHKCFNNRVLYITLDYTHMELVIQGTGASTTRKTSSCVNLMNRRLRVYLNYDDKRTYGSGCNVLKSSLRVPGGLVWEMFTVHWSVIRKAHFYVYTSERCCRQRRFLSATASYRHSVCACGSKIAFYLLMEAKGGRSGKWATWAVWDWELCF